MGARGRGLGMVVVLVVGAAILTVQTSAQEPQAEGSLPSGSIYLTVPLIVEEGQHLRIGPDTRISGTSHIEVRGTLEVNGTPGAPAELSVPILLLGNETSTFRQARIWGVQATALELRAGGAELTDVLFDANNRAILASGASHLSARSTIFRDQAGEALYVDEGASVELEGVTFSGNGRGITVYSAQRLHLNNSTLVANGQHVVIDLGPWTSPEPDLRITNNTFGATVRTPERLPALLLRHDTPLVSVERVVNLAGNVIEGAPVGLRAEGRGLVVRSMNDTFLDNDVGVSVQLANVHLDHAKLGNDLDVDGSGTLTLSSATYLRQTTIPPNASPRAPWWPWVAGGAVAFLVLGALLAPWLTQARVLQRTKLAPLEAEPEAPLDLSVPITPPERRILNDILLHPGTTQRAVTERLGYTRQALHYHVKRLEARGLVKKEVEGRETRCRVPSKVASILSATSVTQTGSQEKG